MKVVVGIEDGVQDLDVTRVDALIVAVLLVSASDPRVGIQNAIDI